MTVEILKETTKWDDGTPNHTYAYNSKTNRMIAFRRCDNDEIKVMSRPIQFDKRGRSFKKIHDPELYLLAISS